MAKAAWKSASLTFTPGGLWLLDEASGLPQDSSGNANHATSTTGSPTYAGGEGGVTFVAASTQYFTIADANSLDMADIWTIEAWVKNPTAAAASKGIFSKGNAGSYLRLQTRLPATLKESTALLMVGGASIAADSAWHHLVATKTGTTQHIYLDGALSDGSVTSTSACTSTAIVATIGANFQHNEMFDGSLRWIAYYPTALSSGNVTTLYNAGIASGSPGQFRFGFR